MIKFINSRLSKEKTGPTKYFLPMLFYRLRHPQKCNAEEIKKYWVFALEEFKDSKVKDLLKLHIHIPFCQKKCNFCFYYSAHSTPDDRIISCYVKRTCKEIAFYKAIFAKSEFAALEIRGGSPSILSEKELFILLRRIFNNFRFSKSKERSFECNPHEITPKKLKILKDFGFRSLNFGVQSLDDKVLKIANRKYQDYISVKEAILSAKAYGFRVKVDLMIGLYGDSADSFFISFKKMAKLGPECIALNPLHPSVFYLEKYFKNDEKFFYSQLRNKIFQAMRLVGPVATKFGYIYDDRIYLHRWQCVGFSKKDTTIENRHNKNDILYSVFGVGFNSSSNIIGLTRYQNKPQLNRDFDPQEDSYSFFTCQLRDDMREYILEHFAVGEPVSRTHFKNIFGQNLLDAFSFSFSALEEFGAVKIEKEFVSFLPKGLEDMSVYGLFFWGGNELQTIADKIMENSTSSRKRYSKLGKMHPINDLR